MKPCFKCNEMNPLTEFYEHPEMKDGHLNKCKDCTKRDVSHGRRNNPHAREYDKKRYQENGVRRKQTIERAMRWRKDNPEKYKAHTDLNNAIRAGKINRAPCEVCGGKAHAHHEDYTKPFDVRWLCAAHHQQLHHSEG